MPNPQGFPQVGAPFVDLVTGRITVPWYRLLVTLWNQDSDAVVATGITALTGGQEQSALLSADWNEVTTTPSGGGVLLPLLAAGRLAVVVFNRGAHALNVFPAHGAQIDALGANAAYSLASGKMQAFYPLSSSQLYSSQFG